MPHEDDLHAISRSLDEVAAELALMAAELVLQTEKLQVLAQKVAAARRLLVPSGPPRASPGTRDDGSA